jgi:hypothetical protein
MKLDITEDSAFLHTRGRDKIKIGSWKEIVCYPNLDSGILSANRNAQCEND